MTALRVVRSGAIEPARNMAIDDALFELRGAPTLRLYRWSPAGLSLGYFQRYAAFAELEGSHQIVRRSTGGGAIYHDDELTFALTLDAAGPAREIRPLYRAIHSAVAAALSAVGVEVTMLDCDAPRSRSRDDWCFEDPGPFDLMLGSRKLVGSAQRRARGRVLHHGSLVLRTPAATPFCAALADRVDPVAVAPALEAALVASLAGALELEPRDADLEPDELRRADGLREQRHLARDFVRRR